MIIYCVCVSSCASTRVCVCMCVCCQSPSLSHHRSVSLLLYPLDVTSLVAVVVWAFVFLVTCAVYISWKWLHRQPKRRDNKHVLQRRCYLLIHFQWCNIVRTILLSQKEGGIKRANNYGKCAIITRWLIGISRFGAPSSGKHTKREISV